jgi:RNA polymerase sigma factor (sigma-70 family)
MSDETSAELQTLIDRLRAGDETARRELGERAYGRLRRLTAAILRRDFPALARGHDVESVVNDVWIRLLPALDSRPPTVADFFRLVAFKVRQVLLDLVDRERLRAHAALAGPGDTAGAADPSDHSHDPGRLAAWTEFHRHVDRLPEEQRAVFELHYYLDLPQAEVAEVLGLHPRKVSRLWVSAQERLADALPDPRR